jgi:Family of unknown function (DUF5318)
MRWFSSAWDHGEWWDHLASRAMSFRVEAIKGTEHGGTVDYRLARAGVLAEYRKGRLARHEVCDAHPELLRVARDYIEATTDLDCPVCEEAKVKLVSYVFGSYLGPSGRCVKDKKELAQVTRRKGTYRCYVVEVCAECGWNHLSQVFEV